MKLVKPITLGELKTAVEKGSKNKAQRADGVVYEFYVHFGYVIERKHMIILLYTIRSYETEISS
jgi:hypothetical protein